MTAPILVCTVGGSPDPIVKAIEDRSPRFVEFICSAEEVFEDGVRSPSSASEVTKPGGILERTGRHAGDHAVTLVPPDDPDRAFFLIRQALVRLRRTYPETAIVADYTGGTKSMTAALMLAAVGSDDPGIGIEFVSGVRRDLVKVIAGTEKPLRLAVASIAAERDLERAARAWRSFAYQEAAELLAGHATAPDPRLPAALAQRLHRTARLSQGYAAWDRFAHGEALEILEPVGVPVDTLRRLAANAGRTELDERGQRRWLPPEDPLICLDLWRNACRRAGRGRYDDAIARAYRLVEATAQYVLWTGEPRIDTGAATREMLGDRLFAKFSRGRDLPKLKIGLDQALETVRACHPQHWLAQLGATDTLRALTEWRERRNQSILAHGFEPLAKADWAAVKRWLGAHLVPQLEAEAARLGLRHAQLPEALPADG
jgi:CRISPR-associated protein (TIGR02710 family)